MHISHLILRNFRQYGDDENKLDIAFNSGVTALVGPNDPDVSELTSGLQERIS